MNATPSKCVFLDKDGTLVENLPYNADPSRMRLVERAGAALRLLHEAGFAFVVVSNQSGIARGFFTEESMRPLSQRLEEMLAAEGVPLTAFYYCPHHPDGSVPEYSLHCTCRKPAPGLLWLAAETHGLSLRESWLIGDILDDVEAGNRAGCRTVLLDNGGETEWALTPLRRPGHLAADLYEAAWTVLAHERPFLPAVVAGGGR